MHKLKESLPLMLLVVASCDAFAYVGPGPGLGVGTIGVIIGITVSIFLALFAVLWYPIKRLFKGKRSTSDKTEDKATDYKE